MKALLLVIVALVAVQEQHTPPGHWCQRPPVVAPQGHECACRKNDCTDADPDHVSAHQDPMCKNYCHQHECLCIKADCP